MKNAVHAPMCVLVCVCQCLVMLEQWLSQQKHVTNVTNATDLLRDALRAIGRHDVIAQCMTDYQQVPPDDFTSRQDALNALVERT